MQYWIGYGTARGRKKSNQDSILALRAEYKGEELAFAVVCDGMGGLDAGELASASLIGAFDKWFANELPVLLQKGFSAEKLFRSWDVIIQSQNKKLEEYGINHSIQLGTTIAAVLLYEQHHYAVNVGDTRVYLICNGNAQSITHDHTLVMKAVEMGQIEYEDMETDPRRNILVQCVGAQGEVRPDFYEDIIPKDSIYLVCSDGFRHLLSEEELWKAFCPKSVTTKEELQSRSERVVQVVDERGERDNITVVALQPVNFF